jgi:alkaline phosphatase D
VGIACGLACGGVGEGEVSKIDRRAFLAGVVAAAVAGAAAAGCSDDEDDDTAEAEQAERESLDPASRPPLPENLPAELFALGVASGDPLPDSVILWTRIVADPVASDGGVGGEPIPVEWELAADREFADVVASGEAAALPAMGPSIHVDATDLEAAACDWDRFGGGDRVSPIGRTRTTPGHNSEPDRLRFAFASCQNQQDGYWTAYQHLAEEDIDLVMFLGDYIYEEGPDANSPRAYRSAAPTDLASYRARWADYKSDPALQAAHAHVPWVSTWDDHEVANDYAGDIPQFANPDDEATITAFRQRRLDAYQAFYEHTPIRLPTNGDPEESGSGFDSGSVATRIYRGVDWGTLAKFYVLDGRQYRTNQACDETAVIAGTSAGPICAEAEEDSRTMLGEEQENWLYEALAGSEARWNVLAQQTVVTSVPFAAGIYNLDQWDGYPAARERLVEQLADVSNPVVITGDIHLSGVGTVADGSGTAVAAELVGTSISSGFPFADVVESAAATVPEVHYVNARERGYVVCDVRPDELRAEFRYVSTVTEPQAELTTGASWVVADGNSIPQSA